VEIMAKTADSERVALITGAGRGLGAACVRIFSEAGYAVAGLEVDAKAAEQLTCGCDRVIGYACDVGDPTAVATTVAAVLERFGRIDVAVNCAGIDHTYWLEDLTVEQFDQVLAVNLRGPFLVAKSVWPVMRRQGGGHVVNVASTAAVRAWSGASAYHASKFGVLGLSRGLGAEGRRDGIRVTTVIPGGMRTGFFDRFADQGIPQPAPETLQDPADVARAILFAVEMPAGSVIQELIVTPPNEPSWP
jgi:NAD(P)-dependent dehydrogenase (short-subunit alcohol dehydrogenase family)